MATQFPSTPVQTHTSMKSLPKPAATSAADQHWEAMKLLTEADVAQHEALRQLGIWNGEIESLRSNESGDVVAVNEDLVRKLAYVFGKKRMEESDVQVLGKQIGLLQQRLETAAGKDPPEALSAREMYEVRQLHNKAYKARQDWETSLEEARAIVLKARFEANPVVQPTLQQGLDKIGVEQVLGKLSKKMARAEEEPIVEEFSVPTTSTVDPELRARALSTEVQSALAPFLQPRTIQPSSAGSFSIKFSRTFDEKPMSLGKLMSIGALSESVLGLKKLALIGGNRKLPEPKWSIASQPNNWNEGDERFLRKSQQMLRDYGAILVEEGLLSR